MLNLEITFSVSVYIFAGWSEMGGAGSDEDLKCTIDLMDKL